mmetsp:Transcript_5083/g.18357  ORF Transcript_5083/g.18357 Transcript_5083/m.18357 type:complete len:227 (-) Transcript_5083:84-764(-)
MKSRTMSWYMPWTMTWYFIVLLTRGPSLPWGLSSSRSWVGCSVASASAAIESIIKLTQRSCRTVRGIPFWEMTATKESARATRLMVTWNWRNFLMFLKMDRPHSTLFTMEEKLSSRMTMSLASLATSVPVLPMLRPTLDSLRAGASLVPSPVTATTSPCFFSSLTKISLSLGEDLARTCNFGSIGMSSSSDMFLKSCPSRQIPSPKKMPHSAPMCFAVFRLSLSPS